MNLLASPYAIYSCQRNDPNTLICLICLNTLPVGEPMQKTPSISQNRHHAR